MEIARKIIQIVPGDWDVIWFCRTQKEIYKTKAMFCAAVKEYEIKRDTSGRVCDRQYLWDSVIPIDPSDIGIGGIVDSDEYIGIVPAGVDPRDPQYALEFPMEARDAA
ncbi:hypothetical protein Enr13x_27940 [Stieleria neptunia]|uniref:Uncharacterized protein n=1 Tax=Stieleria neptunia TaxID=2527979 RepID=A0A518HQ24_9BACT|nr:hypothetical protein [Stieleria neptunia]QDV42942.1 hypothetical protein Enr13x_27940 [Stieleria neptunia]